MTAVLFVAQRLTAAVLAFAVTAHIVTIIYAARGGFSAGDILGRTHRNGWFLALYAVFVSAVAIHAPIGLRNILREWTPWHGRTLDVAMVLLALSLFTLGIRAALAVYLP
jgi:succinate dehydrogenase subunit C